MANSTYDLITEADLTGTGTITINNIPQDYRHLHVLISYVGTNADVYGAELDLDPNTTNRYKRYSFDAYNGNTTARSESTGNTLLQTGLGPDGLSGTGYDNYQSVWIWDYKSQTPGGHFRAGWRDKSNTYGSWSVNGGYKITANMSSIVVSNAFSSWTSGKIRIYGVL